MKDRLVKIKAWVCIVWLSKKQTHHFPLSYRKSFGLLNPIPVSPRHQFSGVSLQVSHAAQQTTRMISLSLWTRLLKAIWRLPVQFQRPGVPESHGPVRCPRHQVCGPGGKAADADRTAAGLLQHRQAPAIASVPNRRRAVCGTRRQNVAWWREAAAVDSIGVTF